MKLRCERDTLVDSLSATARAIGPVASRSMALSGVHFSLSDNHLRLTSNDGDLTIRVDTRVAGEQDGTCLLPARLTSDIVRSLDPGAVRLEVRDDEAVISAGRSEFGVRTLPEHQFPRARAVQSEGVEMAAAELGEALRQVVRAASTEEKGDVRSHAVLLRSEPGGLRLVATDLYRCAERTLAGRSIPGEGHQVLVPARALAEVQRLLSATSGPAHTPAIRLGRGHVSDEASNAGGERQLVFKVGELEATFEIGAVTLTTTLLESFWDAERLDGLLREVRTNKLTVGKEALTDAVRRMRLLLRDTASPVRMSLEASHVQLSATDEERGHASEDLDASYEGEEMAMSFNPNFLIDGVEAVIGDEVVIEIGGPLSPVLVHGAEIDSYRYLLVPFGL